METNVPQDLTTLTAEECQSLIDALVAEFDEMFDAEATPAEMAEVADALTAVRGRKEAVEAETAEAAAERERLRAQVHADPVDEVVDDSPDPDPEPEPEPVDEPVRAEPDRVPVTAASRPSAAATRRGAPRPKPHQAAGPRVVITAAADIPDVPNGAHLDKLGIARAFHDKARGLSDNGVRAPIATVHLPIPDDQWVAAGDGEKTLGVLDLVSDPHGPQAPRANAGGLVAAGGWCTPSEPLYDVFRLDDTQGLFTLPTVGVRRGGMTIPTPLLLDASVSGALWTWTEGTDAATVKTVTNKVLTSNVATLTTSANHNLVVGQTVKVAIGDPVFDGTYVISAVPSATTFSYARTAANVATVAATGTATVQKGCVRIPCPAWTDYRLEAEGLCVSHGNLMDAAYPELTRAFVDLVMNAHEYRVSSAILAKVIASITAPASVTMTTGPSSATSELLSAVDLQLTDYRSQYSMSDGNSLEVIFPDWAKGVFRSDMAMRNGGGAEMAVSDAEIGAWFAVRNARPQFVKNYQPLYSTTPKTAWPTSVKFLVYPTGGYVKGTGPVINLGVTRDSTLNVTNDFTAAWSEQFYTVGQRGPDAREVTVTILVDGVTAVGP